MKTNKRKEIVRNSIKRIGLDCGNRAREIVLQIAIALGFKIHEDEFGVSAYGGNAIRISDHCTYMQTWVDNETWNAPVRLDVVIEDEPTEAVTQVRVGYDFTITEFVSQSSDIDTQKARTIAYDIRNAMNGNPYANNVRGEKRNLVATHGNNTQQINCNTNMNKNKIRLTESQLHNMISESVKQVLSELDWKTYASAADKARDKRLNNKDDYDAYRNTEREDAFNDAASKALSKKYNLRDVETYGDKDNPKKRIVKRFGSTSFTSDRDGVDFNDGELHTFGDMSKHGYAFPIPKDWIDYVMDSPYWRNRSDKERKDAYQNNEMNYDIDAFNHGKYKYVKGKGWQLKK